MGLSRIKLEKKIVKSLTEKAEKLGFQLIKEKYQGNNHNITYTRTENGMYQGFTIRFYKSHHLKMSSGFYIAYHTINSLIKEFTDEEDYIEEHIGVRFTDLEDVIYIDEHENYSTFNQGDIDKIVELSYERYLLHSIKMILPKVNTIPKVEALINDEKHLNKEEVDMYPLTDWVFPVQSHVMIGVILALLCKKSNYKEIIKRYIKYMDFDFEKDEDETIELVYKIIEKYEPELMKLSIRSRN